MEIEQYLKENGTNKKELYEGLGCEFSYSLFLFQLKGKSPMPHHVHQKLTALGIDGLPKPQDPTKGKFAPSNGPKPKRYDRKELTIARSDFRNQQEGSTYLTDLQDLHTFCDWVEKRGFDTVAKVGKVDEHYTVTWQKGG